MARIRIYIGRHLCTAPRPIKEAEALAAAGHEVSVHGLWFDPRLHARDLELLAGRAWTFAPYADARPGQPGRALRWLLLRLSRRLAREAWRLRLVLPDAYAYGAPALRSHALRHPADLALFHSENGLLAAPTLRRHGRRVGVDFEDWFSRDLSPAERLARPTDALAALEAAALRHDTYLLAPSRSLASALRSAHGGREPTVVYNSFPTPPPAPALGADRRDPSRVSLHWFSQTIGPGRGLETLLDALPLLSFPWEIHLRGDDPHHHAPRLLAGLPPALRAHVHLHPTVPNAALPAHLAQHDIGLASDGPVSPSRDLTITNKLFQYLQAGLAVVAGDTAGHREIHALAPSALRRHRHDDPAALASALAQLATDPAALAAAKSAARHAHDTHFAHELHAHLYPDLVARALAD